MKTAKKHSKKGKRLDRKSVEAGFVACSRCSIFLISYRLIHQDLDAALDDIQDGWIHLTWNSGTRKLLGKCLSVHISQDVIKYEAICPDCHRLFVYQTAEEGDQAASLTVAARPA